MQRLSGSIRCLRVAALPALLLLLSAGGDRSGACAQQVGTAAAVNPAAQAGSRILNIGSNIVFREQLNTSAQGSVQVVFVDKTTLNVGPNSSIVIDEFVYNPNAGTGRMTLSLTRGVLRLVGGNVTHTEGATIKTPVATIGVRGGSAAVSHDSDGTSVTNFVGTSTITSGGTSQKLFRPGFGVKVHGSKPGPSAPAKVTAAAIKAIIQATSSKPGQSGGNPRSQAVFTTAAQTAGSGRVNSSAIPSQIIAAQSRNTSQAASGGTPPGLIPGSSGAQDLITQGQQQSTTDQNTQSQAPATRFYALETTGVPYLHPSFVTPGMLVSPLYGYRRGGLTADNELRLGSTTLQAGLAISGTGADQSSSLFVMTGAFRVLPDGTQFHDAGFTGSNRPAADAGMGGARGNADSAPGSVVLDADQIPIAATLTSDERSGSGASTPAQAFFFNPNTPYTFSHTFTEWLSEIPFGQDRSGTGLQGFTAGLMITRHAASPDTSSQDVGPSFPVSGTALIGFDSDRGRVQFNMDVAKVANFNEDTNEFLFGNFQLGNLSPTARGRGAYIDDQLFGARQAVNELPDTPTQTQVSTVNGAATRRTFQAAATSHLLSAQSTLAGVFPGVGFCVCEFTRWGFWSVDSYRLNGDNSEERDRGHLMGWVAGRLASAAEVSAQVGTATYNGHIVGSFKEAGNEYIAASNFQLNANFGTHTAGVTISNLDARNYSGSIGIGPGINSVSGVIAGSSGESMFLNGAFFRGAADPVRDVAGSFTVTAPSSYIGGGIFAASR